MQKPKVFIRADGNASIGMGHIHRTLALAEYLNSNFDVIFCVFDGDGITEELIRQRKYKVINLRESDYSEPNSFLKQIDKTAIVVLDGYNFKTSYQQAVIDNGNKLVAIDDLNQWEQVADVVMNHGYVSKENDYKTSSHTKLYTGLDYVLLKREFLEAKMSSKKTSNKNVLICFGGTDPQNYSEKIIHELLEKTDKTISLITYPVNPNFKKLKEIADENPSRLKVLDSLNTSSMIETITKNDIAILQPSNIALEAASLGIFIGLIQTADNQKYISETLLSKNCSAKIEMNSVAEILNAISVENINTQIENQSKIFDKKSPGRILNIFNSLYLAVRKANSNDVDILFKWSNDKVTRANSYNQTEIEYSSHVDWFTKKLNDKESCFLILEYNKIPAATVRIDVKQKENVIGITVAPEFRGQKLSSLMLEKACNYFFGNFKENKITAYIKEENAASLHSFKNAGFEVQDINDYFGAKSYRLIKQK